MDCLVIGAGLTGAVVAREMAEAGKRVTVWERREHIGGNMYDYVDEHGILVQKYGPHIFHTQKKALYDYFSQYETLQPFQLICGAVWDQKYTSTPFNFATIDTFYSRERAEILKQKLQTAFAGRETVPVIEVLEYPDEDIHGYAQFLFDNDYAPYTAKQWGVQPEVIDPSVLQRVPLRLSYHEGYFSDKYEAMPQHSYTTFFDNILNHQNITVELNVEALHHLSVEENVLLIDGEPCKIPVVYTGALDELFHCVCGRLPYRALRFEWKHEEVESVQEAPVVAYPQETGFTRITEYKKLPVQSNVQGTTYVLEYPLPYQEGTAMEPYYPVLTEESKKLYAQYQQMADRVPNLFYGGRLGDFQYYNMDQALEHAHMIVAKLRDN